MATPVRSFLNIYGKKLNKVAFFATLGGNNPSKSFIDMEQLAGKKPLSILPLSANQLKDGYEKEMTEFIESVNK
jgi:hypothetical protein